MRRYWSFLGHVCRQDFQSRYPARVVLHHIFQQHSQTLSRPGPWSTPHGLLTKFWLEIGLDVDYMLASRIENTGRTSFHRSWLGKIWHQTVVMWNSWNAALGSIRNAYYECM